MIYHRLGIIKNMQGEIHSRLANHTWRSLWYWNAGTGITFENSNLIESQESIYSLNTAQIFL